MTQVQFINGKYQALINGKIVKRANRSHMDYVRRKAGLVPTAKEVSVPTESRFSINDRFGFVTDMVTMLANGKQASVVVTGPGGLGKSYTVSKALESNGFHDITTVDALELVSVLTVAVPSVSSKVILLPKACTVCCGKTVTVYWCLMIVIPFSRIPFL